MTGDKKTLISAAELRRKAEELAFENTAKSTENIKALSPDETEGLLHELRVHQIELEMQNEELRRAQTELQASHERFQDLYDFAPVGYCTVSEQGLILEINLTAATLFGVPRSQLIGNPLSSFILPGDQDIYYRYRKALFATGEPQVCEMRLVRAHKSFFWASLEAIAVMDADGTTVRRIALSDITERKEIELDRCKVEENLRMAKQQWEETFDAIPDIITLQDKDMRIVRTNRAAHRFFGVAYNDLIGKHCYEIFREATVPCQDCPALEGCGGTTHWTGVIQHKGLGKIFQTSSSPLLDTQDETEFFVHVARDITEQKRLEEEIFQLHKMEAMGTLAGGVAHDFNNILSAIIGYAQLAKGDIPPDSVAQKKLDVILESSARAAALVRQILTFSGKSLHDLESFMPHLIIKEALKMMRASLPSTLYLEETIVSNCGTVRADPTKIHQIVVNLCTNAFHAMENEKGILSVSLFRKEVPAEEILESDVVPGNFIVLSVSDTGHGMDEETIKRIFEPYFTKKEVGKGSGLGLSVIHGIVKDYKGFIRVESEPGKGSVFHIYLPALEEDLPSRENIQKEIQGGTERILVVDDESLIVNLHKTILEYLGYDVTATTDSREALKEIKSRPDHFDLLVTDQTMRYLSGVELAKEVLKISPDMPIILATGYSSAVTEEGALTLGIRRYVKKPVDRATLAALVREVLDGEG